MCNLEEYIYWIFYAFQKNLYQLQSKYIGFKCSICFICTWFIRFSSQFNLRGNICLIHILYFFILYELQWITIRDLLYWHDKKKAKTWQRARFTARLFLPLMCLTSVFGMGTGVTTSLSSPDLYFWRSFLQNWITISTNI